MNFDMIAFGSRERMNRRWNLPGWPFHSRLTRLGRCHSHGGRIVTHERRFDLEADLDRVECNELVGNPNLVQATRKMDGPTRQQGGPREFVLKWRIEMIEQRHIWFLFHFPGPNRSSCRLSSCIRG